MLSIAAEKHSISRMVNMQYSKLFSFMHSYSTVVVLTQRKKATLLQTKNFRATGPQLMVKKTQRSLLQQHANLNKRWLGLSHETKMWEVLLLHSVHESVTTVNVTVSGKKHKCEHFQIQICCCQMVFKQRGKECETKMLNQCHVTLMVKHMFCCSMHKHRSPLLT